MSTISTAIRPKQNALGRHCRGTGWIGVTHLLLPAIILWTHATSSPAQVAGNGIHSTLANPHLFQGARYDEETGFYYFRNRYYDPGNGRFLQRDPMWDAANVGNAYTFAANGPASWNDPNGEFVVVLGLGAALGLAIVGTTIAASPSEAQAEQMTAARKQIEAARRQRQAYLQAQVAARRAKARQATAQNSRATVPTPARCAPSYQGPSMRNRLSPHELVMAQAYAWRNGGALDQYQRLLTAGQASLAALPGPGRARMGQGPLPAASHRVFVPAAQFGGSSAMFRQLTAPRTTTPRAGIDAGTTGRYSPGEAQAARQGPTSWSFSMETPEGRAGFDAFVRPLGIHVPRPLRGPDGKLVDYPSREHDRRSPRCGPPPDFLLEEIPIRYNIQTTPPSDAWDGGAIPME